MCYHYGMDLWLTMYGRFPFLYKEPLRHNIEWVKRYLKMEKMVSFMLKQKSIHLCPTKQFYGFPILNKFFLFQGSWFVVRHHGENQNGSKTQVQIGLIFLIRNYLR